jgi:hypothetical protein
VKHDKLRSLLGRRNYSKRRSHARDDGQIPADADPKQLARFYGAAVQSLGVAHKPFGEAAALRDIVVVAMRGWPGRSRGTTRRTTRRPQRRSSPSRR